MNKPNITAARASRRGSHIVADPETFAATAAAFLGRQLSALTDVRAGSIALSGGSTPGPVYELLAGNPQINWSKLDVYFADERVVPYADAHSNYRLVRETLLDRVDVPPTQVHPMPVEEADLEQAAATYGASLPEQIDILILGLGQDGHTASIFPGAPAFASDARIGLSEAPSEPRRRMTITPSVIASARLVVVLARGKSKVDALAAALRHETKPDACPARLAKGAVWILDRELAAALPNEPMAQPGPA